MYCIKMKRAEPEFWSSTYRKIVHLIDRYADEMSMKAAAINGEEYHSKFFENETVEEISSMKQIAGFGDGRSI